MNVNTLTQIALYTGLVWLTTFVLAGLWLWWSLRQVDRRSRQIRQQYLERGR